MMLLIILYPFFIPIYHLTEPRKKNRHEMTIHIRLIPCRPPVTSGPNDDDNDVYFKKDYNDGAAKSNPTQECRPAKGISKRVNIQIIKDTDEQPNNK
jgi:hypothetical protein